MASSSTAFHLKDAGFHVRNVPKEWNDWNLFHVFQKFGRVGYCRIVGQAHDGLSQTGFVNMLSVKEADNVRKNLFDGCISGSSFSIKVSDLKNASSLMPSMFHKIPAPTQPKNLPVRIPSAWLPLNQKVEVEVVDFLPISTIPADMFALTLMRIDNSAIQERYNTMCEKMHNYAQLQPFENDIQFHIGFDGVHREGPRSVWRCRRISANRVYLLDTGKIVPYDKTKIFQLPKVFQVLPTKVALCGVDGLKWTKEAIPTFDRVRNVVKQWGAIENSSLHAVTCGFFGSLNMITLYCKQSILAERLQRKGACEYVPRNEQPKYAYSRDALLGHKNTDAPAKISNDADVVKDLLKKIDGAKAMLRELNLG